MIKDRSYDVATTSKHDVEEKEMATVNKLKSGFSFF